MPSTPSSLKRFAWIITTLGAVVVAAGYLYFQVFAETPNTFGTWTQTRDQRMKYSLDATQSGMVEILGLIVLGIGVVMLIVAYKKPTASAEQTSENAPGAP